MKWIVVQTKPKSEQKAYVNLQRQGYSVFFPKIKKSIKRLTRIHKLITPLFPGYLFVFLKDQQTWSKINNTYGVFKILKFNDQLCYLPDDTLAKLKKRCDKNGLVIKSQIFNTGEKLVYSLNKYTFLDVIFDEHIDNKRSFVLIEFLKKKIRTKIKTKYLEVVI